MAVGGDEAAAVTRRERERERERKSAEKRKRREGEKPEIVTVRDLRPFGSRSIPAVRGYAARSLATLP